LGFEEAWKGWVELYLSVVLVVAEGMWWRWEGGLIDRCIGEWAQKYGGVYGEKEGNLEDKEAMVTKVDVESKS
jgi:hypothetical protein